jgi:hypothetical protein
MRSRFLVTIMRPTWVVAGPLAWGLLGCHSSPAEPTAAAAPDEGAASEKAPATHVIVEKDHRHLLTISRGDYLELPHDPEFVWSIHFQNHSYFDDASPSDAGIERYRASRSGIVQTKVSGDPKICLHSDAPCPLAKYDWSVNVAVE